MILIVMVMRVMVVCDDTVASSSNCHHHSSSLSSHRQYHVISMVSHLHCHYSLLYFPFFARFIAATDAFSYIISWSV